MSTATDLQEPSNKRTRFSANATPSALPGKDLTIHKVQPPKSLAESFIRSSIALLHPIIATNVEKLGKEHITMLSKKNHLDKANQRLVNDNDIIPSSARINFELSVSDRVKEMPEYKELQDKTIEAVNTAQKSFKTQIVAASKLELVAITNEIKFHLIKSIRLITNSLLLYYNDTTNLDEAVYLLAKHYLPQITIHIPMNLRDFIILYKKVHTIETFPPSTSRNTTTTTTSTTQANQDPSVSPFFGGGGESGGSNSSNRAANRSSEQSQQSQPEQNQTQVVVIIPPQNITKIKELFENVFVTSWSRFLEQQHQNELAIELKKMSTTFFTTRATSEATSIVDAEPAADKQELQELIRLQTINETKHLLKQLNDMKKQLNNLTTSKNSNQRGQGSASAKKTKTPTTVTNKNSRNKNKKKKTTTTSSSTSKKTTGNNNKKRKVDDNKDVSDSGAKNSKKKRGTNKSSKNGKSSNNKKHQAKNKSTKK